MRAIEYKYQLEKKREENEFRKFSSQLLMLLNKKKLINVCKTKVLMIANICELVLKVI